MDRGTGGTQFIKQSIQTHKSDKLKIVNTTVIHRKRDLTRERVTRFHGSKSTAHLADVDVGPELGVGAAADGCSPLGC